MLSCRLTVLPNPSLATPVWTDRHHGERCLDAPHISPSLPPSLSLLTRWLAHYPLSAGSLHLLAARVRAILTLRPPAPGLPLGIQRVQGSHGRVRLRCAASQDGGERPCATRRAG